MGSLLFPSVLGKRVSIEALAGGLLAVTIKDDRPD